MKTFIISFILIFSQVCQAQIIDVHLPGGSSIDIINAINQLDNSSGEPYGTIYIEGNIIVNKNISIPKKVILSFKNNTKLIINGLNDKTIHFENAYIDANKFQIFEFLSFGANYDDKISRITGKVKNNTVYPEWFGGSPIETTGGSEYALDDSYAIQLSINLTGSIVEFSAGNYRIYNTLKKVRNNDENINGVSFIGAGIKETSLLVMKDSINFIEIKGLDGSSGHKPIEGNTFKNFRLSGQSVASNGFYLFASVNNSFENLEIHHFLENAILFDGNPDLNPDLTASFLTNIKFCNIRDNKVGIFSKINNVSPTLTLSNSRVNRNFRSGIIWNSSYFHSVDSSISFNGRSIEGDENIDLTDNNPLGGFYNEVQNNYGDDHFYSPYYSKGIIIETTELDGNYPSAIVLKSSTSALIRNNALQQTDQYFANFKFSQKGLISIGGDNINSYVQNGENKTYRELSRNTVIENNRISFNKTKTETQIDTDAAIIRVSKWGIYSKIRNNCFEDNAGTNNSILGNINGYKYIKEYSRENITTDWDNEDSYVKLIDNECIADSKIDSANDLYLSKFKKPNKKDYAAKFDFGDEIIIEVPTIKEENGLEVKAGSFILSSNDPGAISGLFFYRSVLYPQIHSAYSSSRISTTTSNSNNIPIDILNNFNICVFDNGTIRLKSNYPNTIYIAITFLEKIGMYSPQ